MQRKDVDGVSIYTVKTWFKRIVFLCTFIDQTLKQWKILVHVRSRSGVANLWRMRKTWRIAWLKVAHCIFKMKINEV